MMYWGGGALWGGLACLYFPNTAGLSTAGWRPVRRPMFLFCGGLGRPGPEQSGRRGVGVQGCAQNMHLKTGSLRHTGHLKRAMLTDCTWPGTAFRVAGHSCTSCSSPSKQSEYRNGQASVVLRCPQVSIYLWLWGQSSVASSGGGGRGRGGGGCLRPWPAPAYPPTHMRKIVLRQKMKVMKRAGNMRLIVGTQTTFGL